MTNCDLYGLFDFIPVVSLERRTDRWQAFIRGLPADWPFRPPKRFPAVDGERECIPDHWTSSAGAWGCFQSHLAILKHAIDHDLNRILIFEDDAALCSSFSEDVKSFIAELPNDWDLIYLGGQHIELELGVPEKVTDWVYRSVNANRTHCFAFQGRENIQRVYEFLKEPSNWTPIHHVDHFLGRYQKEKGTPTYVPKQWIVAQNSGESDIFGQTFPLRVFQSAEDVSNPIVHLPMVAIVGTFFSGAGVVASFLQHLGLPIGSRFDWPNFTERKGSAEQSYLGLLCRSMFDLESLEQKVTDDVCVRLLRTWACGHSKEHRSKVHVVGGKCNLFCMLGRHLNRAWHQPLFVSVERDITESTGAVLNFWPNLSESAVRNLIVRMNESWAEFVRSEHPRVYRIDFNDFLKNPSRVASDLCAILGLTPPTNRIEIPKNKPSSFLQQHSRLGQD